VSRSAPVPCAKCTSLSKASVSKEGIFEASLCYRRVEGPISRMRNARQSTATSRSAWIPTRQVRAAMDGERAKPGSTRRAGTKIAAPRAQFREYAKRGSPTPCHALPRSHATNVHHYPRWACQKRESSRRRCDIAEARAQFREYAMRGSPRSDPTRRGSPRAKYAPLLTVSAPKQRTFEALARKTPR
jgi:hypothetical protein